MTSWSIHWYIQFRHVTLFQPISLILFYVCRTLPFQSYTLKKAVPKFEKSSVDLQHSTLLENKNTRNISRFLPTLRALI